MVISAYCLVPSFFALCEFLHDRIVEQWSKLLDPFISPTRVDAIGQQDYRDPFLQVKPKGRAGEAEMANTPC